MLQKTSVSLEKRAEKAMTGCVLTEDLSHTAHCSEPGPVSLSPDSGSTRVSSQTSETSETEHPCPHRVNKTLGVNTCQHLS